MNVKTIALDKGKARELFDNDSLSCKVAADNLSLPLDAATQLDLINELQLLRQLVVNADAVSRARFEYYGLCDCIDNCGGPYPSQWSHDLIERAKTTVAVDERLKRFAG